MSSQESGEAFAAPLSLYIKSAGARLCGLDYVHCVAYSFLMLFFIVVLSLFGSSGCEGSR